MSIERSIVARLRESREAESIEAKELQDEVVEESEEEVTPAREEVVEEDAPTEEEVPEEPIPDEEVIEEKEEPYKDPTAPIERKIIEKLKESRRLDEAFPPVLNKLSKHEKDTVRKELTKMNIDIENTPYESAVVTNGRDPRLKGNNVAIFEFGDINVAVWCNNRFIIDAYLYNIGKQASKASWKDILGAATRITSMQFDNDTAATLRAKKSERYDLKKSATNVRYTQKNKPRYVTLDKSGYIVEPKKYQKMLAAMKVASGDKVLQQAKEVYAKLAQRLGDIDFDDRSLSSFESYDYIMKEIVSTFQSLTRSLKEYEKYKADKSIEGESEDTWWFDHLKERVASDIQDMRDLMNKAKKYL